MEKAAKEWPTRSDPGDLVNAFADGIGRAGFPVTSREIHLSTKYMANIIRDTLGASGLLAAAISWGAAATLWAATNEGFNPDLCGQVGNHLARLTPDGRLDAPFTIGADNGVVAVAVQPDGKILVGGRFGMLSGQFRSYLGRLHPDGTLDTAFNPTTGGWVGCVAVQPDGKIVVGNSYRFQGSTLYRLNEDGSPDSTFTCNLAYNSVNALAVQPDGKLLVAGSGSLVRLNTNGSVETTFNSGGATVSGLAVQPDGKVLIGGYFSNIQGQAHQALARFHPNGSLDNTFNASAVYEPESFRSAIMSFLVQSDGKILIAGAFTRLNNQPRSYLGRLNPDGSLDTGFQATADGYIYSWAQQADGKILVGGCFTNLCGQPRRGIGRLNADGTLDDTFKLPEIQGDVVSLAMSPDGTLLAGGSLNGESSSFFGRPIGSGAGSGTFELDAATATICWWRDGVVPEVQNVTFELSTNGIQYQMLGNASRIPGGWQLAPGLMPVGRSFFVRARGRVSCGYNNGSSGLIEAVRQCYWLDPPRIAAPSRLPDGSFQFTVTHPAAASFRVWATTNLALPLAAWISLGPPAPVGGDVFQFIDRAARNYPRRYYQLRAP